MVIDINTIWVYDDKKRFEMGQGELWVAWINMVLATFLLYWASNAWLAMGGFFGMFFLLTLSHAICRAIRRIE